MYVNHQANNELIYKQAFRRSHPGPCGQLLVVWVPHQRIVGRLERADPTGPMGRSRGPPRALAHLLVEHPEALPGVQCHRLQSRHPLSRGHGRHPQVCNQALRRNKLISLSLSHTHTFV
jgi:hypothetical protein